MKPIANLLISSLAVFAADYILPGVTINNFTTTLMVAIALAVVNMFIRPVLLVLTFPLTVVSLGLFTFIINGLLVLLIANLVPGFTVVNFWWAILFSLVVSIANSALHSLTK